MLFISFKNGEGMKDAVRITIGLMSFLALICDPATIIAKPTVYVTSYPLKRFAESIASNSVHIVFPVPADMNPIFWMPDPGTIADMQKADLIVLNGATFEKWLAFVSLPPSKLVDTSTEFKAAYIRVKDAVTHSHGAQGEHTHVGIHYATWLDFNLAVRQARVIEKAFSALLPEQKPSFNANYQRLSEALKRLDRLAASIGGDIGARPLLASHPFLEYFARRYSLNLKSLHWFHGSVPDAGQWKEFKEILKQHPAKWMIWEAQPVGASIEKLKSVGIDSIVFNPCYSAPSDGDFVVTMEKNLENLMRIIHSSD
jgi:zinc transport system substrate-binding protein